MDAKILVISDLKDTVTSTLHTAANLAKTLNTSLYFLSVSKPIEIVGNESQLTALRNINYKQSKAIDEIKSLVNPIKKSGVSVHFKHSIGNVKNEILAHIKVLQPEIIVLGKRKNKNISIVGDKLTEFILKHYQGIVILADQKESIPHKPYSLAILCEELSDKGQQLANLLSESNEKPTFIKLDSIKKGRLSLKKTILNPEILKGFSDNYNLIFTNRYNHKKNLKKVISKVECSVVITN